MEKRGTRARSIKLIRKIRSAFLLSLSLFSPPCLCQRSKLRPIGNCRAKTRAILARGSRAQFPPPSGRPSCLDPLVSRIAAKKEKRKKSTVSILVSPQCVSSVERFIGFADRPRSIDRQISAERHPSRGGKELRGAGDEIALRISFIVFSGDRCAA